MPMLTMTLDDASPLLSYTGHWDPKLSDDASHGTYTMTEDLNASVTFNFVGTWVQVNGSRNSAHGTYTVQLDDVTYPLNGSSLHDTPFKTPIFTSPKLEPGPHNLTITNNEWMTLDIDSISWDCNIGPHNASNSTIETSTTDDSNSAFTYLPHGAWNMNPPNVTSFMKKTGHSTSQVNASVSYNFSGDAVAIYGSTGPGNSRYTVLRPDAPPQTFTAQRGIFSSQVLLYFGENFGSGNQTITLVNESPGLFELDYAVVHRANFTVLASASTSPPASSSLSPSPRPPTGTPWIPSDSTRQGLPAGAIAAITLTAFFSAFLLVLVWFLLRRNKTLWMRLQRGYMVQSQFDTSSPPTGVTPLILPAASPPPRRAAAAARAKGGDLPDENESFVAGPPNRTGTMMTQLTASTLVADAGSVMTQEGDGPIKPLRLVSRWGPGTPTTTASQPSLSPTTQRVSRSPSMRHYLPRSPSTRHLLQPQEPEDPQYYDPYAAATAMPGLEEVPEDRVDDILRHPIRRHEPSGYRWQSGLP